MEYEMKFFVLLIAIFMYGCATKLPASGQDGSLMVNAENVTVSLNNLKAKNGEVVSRFPDEYGVQTIFTWNMFGSPVNAKTFDAYLDDNKMRLTSSSVNSGDFVGHRLGGNYGLYVHDKEGQAFNVVHHYSKGSNAFVTRTVTSISLGQTQEQSGSNSLSDLFKPSSPHSNYSCVIRCGAEPPRITRPSDNQE